MRIVGIDIESDTLTKELVCISYAERRPLSRAAGGIDVWVHAAHEPECMAHFLGMLSDPDVVLVGMAWALDAVTLCKWGGETVRRAIVAKMEACRVSDVFVREWLLWVAFPAFTSLWQCATPWHYISPDSEDRHGAGDDKRPAMSLAALVRRWCNRNIEASKAGEDSIRLSFYKVRGLPVSEWSVRYVDYACDDARDHLLVWEAQQSGQSRNSEVDNAALSGLMKLFAGVRKARPDLADLWTWHLPGEYKAVIDALPMAWLCDPANGGLYCDVTYCDLLIERYRSVALSVETVAGRVLRNVALRGQQDLFGGLSSTALIKQSKIVKVNKLHLRTLSHALFDMMPGTWAPPPTATGIRTVGRFARAWREWTPKMRRWASLSGKVLSECMLTLLSAGEPSLPLARCLAWLLPSSNSGHALHAVSLGKWDAAQVLADSAAIEDLTIRRLWAYVVRDTCLRCITNSLAPLAALTPSEPLLDGRSTHRAVTPTRSKMLITGRYSLEGAIRQNANRAGGVREALIPQAGWSVFLADFSQIELLGFAGAIEYAYMKAHGLTTYESSLSKVLKAGKDAHIVLALDLLAQTGAPDLQRRLVACSVEFSQAHNSRADEWLIHDTAASLRKLGKAWPHGTQLSDAAHVGVVLDELRERAKRLNYGLGGMMQPAKFIETQRKQGDYTWTLASATEAWSIWRRRWHESHEFEKWCREIVARGGYFFHDRCWRARGGLTLTQAANTTFQTPIAEMFKVAMWRAWNETFDSTSALYGCKVVLPIHDEIVCVGPTEQAPFALKRLREIMVTAGEEYLPGLPVGTSGAVMSRFGKAA